MNFITGVSEANIVESGSIEILAGIGSEEGLVAISDLLQPVTNTADIKRMKQQFSDIDFMVDSRFMLANESRLSCGDVQPVPCRIYARDKSPFF